MDKSVFHMNSKGLFSEFLSLALMTLEPARPPPAPLLLPLTAIPGHPGFVVPAYLLLAWPATTELWCPDSGM